jgi:hypothetical protein
MARTESDRSQAIEECEKAGSTFEGWTLEKDKSADEECASEEIRVATASEARLEFKLQLARNKQQPEG